MEELFKLKERARILGIDLCWGKEYIVLIVTKNINAVYYKKNLHLVSLFLDSFDKKEEKKTC